VLIFLAADVTDRQRSALESALGVDSRVGVLHFENRDQAYQRFRTRWESNPDLLAAVGADRLPESFRLRLVNASQYTALRGQYAAMAGVEQIIGRTCPPRAPVGGTL
jgi:cell division transport system permease protein